MQPVVIDNRGAPRFRGNALVRQLLDEAAKRGYTLNDLLGFGTDHPQADVEQFYQLVGYSVGGYCELSLVSDESADAAVKAAVALGYPWQQGEETVREWRIKNGYPAEG